MGVDCGLNLMFEGKEKKKKSPAERDQRWDESNKMGKEERNKGNGFSSF